MIAMVKNRLLFVAYTIREERTASSRPAKLNPTSNVSTMTETEKYDWGRFDALTDAEVHEAAPKDPDAQPLRDEALALMKSVPRAKTLRRALGLTQEEFAARYRGEAASRFRPLI
jgi:hypothetical protein